MADSIISNLVINKKTRTKNKQTNKKTSVSVKLSHFYILKFITLYLLKQYKILLGNNFTNIDIS